MSNPNAYRTQEIQRIKRENDELKEEIQGLRRFVQALDSLYNATAEFDDDSELFSFMRNALTNAMQLLNAPDGTMALVDDETDEIVFVIVNGALKGQLTDHRIPTSEGVAGWVVRNAKPTMVRDVRRDPRFHSGIDDHYSFKTQSIAAAPLIGTRDGKSKVYGLVEVLNQPGDQPFSEDDMVILKLFCRSVGDALAHIDQMKSDKEDAD
ncbi:MAG: GAF domain-containing protein [Chloroflexota bacterium]